MADDDLLGPSFNSDIRRDPDYLTSLEEMKEGTTNREGLQVTDDDTSREVFTTPQLSEPNDDPDSGTDGEYITSRSTADDSDWVHAKSFLESTWNRLCECDGSSSNIPGRDNASSLREMAGY